MSIRIRTSVPASTANLGPGYDILGLALDLRLAATATFSPEWSVLTRGAGSHLLDTCDLNLIARAYRQACETNGWEVSPLAVETYNPIPIAKGLGSSAAAIVTGMALAQLIHIGRIEKDSLFAEAAELEGHPDNIAAAVYGGLQEVVHDELGLEVRTREVADSVRVLLVIPGEMKSTAELRQILPDRLPEEIHIANDTAVRKVLAGLAAGDPELLCFSEADQRHQPYRLAVQPTSRKIFDLLSKAQGVAGAFLSGAGTTVAGWVVGDRDPTDDVKQILAEHSIPAEVRLSSIAFTGVEGEVVHD